MAHAAKGRRAMRGFLPYSSRVSRASGEYCACSHGAGCRRIRIRSRFAAAGGHRPHSADRVRCSGLRARSLGLGLVEFGLDDHTVLLVGEIALAIVLFTDAARTNLSALRQNEALPLRLLGIGMPLTIALGTLAAALVLT